ncbi:HlyD family efflux transporter periplasmic adaptor subunit [Botrimarina sp.]|uniref:HlyD family secretion protein n=1 Tax=Botrimarina sp. TaxID=2795802 RepID=UPI0032ECFE24
MSRFIWLAIAVAVIGASAAVIDRRSSAPAPPTRRAIALPDVISAPGIVEGASADVLLRPEVRGLVVERFVEVGDRVERGGPLLRLDDRRARLAVRSAEAELASAQAELDRLLNGARSHEREEARALRQATSVRLNQAKTNLDRLVRLERQSAVSGQEADDARANVENLVAQLAAADARVAMLEAPARDDEVRLARARIAAAEANVEVARLALEKTTIVSPIDGRVLDLDAQVGELVSPDQGPVAVVADTSRLRVRAYVEEFDAPRVEAGATAEVRADGLPETAYAGRVATVGPRMTAKSLFSGEPNELYDTKVREVVIDLSGAANLIVGLRVDVRLGPTAREARREASNTSAQ